MINKLKTNSGILYYEDRQKEGANFLVRTILSAEGGLEKNINSRHFFNKEKEGITILRALTNNRYPSFYTFSHALGGSDNGPSLNLSWFNEKGYDILEEQIKEGICVASPINERAFMGYGNSNDIGHIPLFVFGNKNKQFTNFLKNKYKNVLDKKNLDNFISKGNFLKAKIFRQGPIGGFNNHSSFHAHVGLIHDIEKPKDVYCPPWNVYYESAKKSALELDYGLLFGNPLWADDGDGAYVSTDITFNEKGEINTETNNPIKLKWKDAEIMIDMYGLFDGKKKIIFFNPNS